MRNKALAAGLHLVLLSALPGLAQDSGPGMTTSDYIMFQSPTGNIHCAIYTWVEGAEARCDLRELQPTYTRPPLDCMLDWGNAFAVGNRGEGFLVCAGDTVIDSRSFVLPYGEAVSLGGISCVSAKTGMTCTNAEGHGFSVAKAKQRLF